MSEEDLIKKISSDDRLAFEEVFRAHYSDLCKFGMKYVRDSVISEEVVQEVFINIWERRKTLTISSSVKAYLFTAVRNRCFNYLKLQLPKEQNKVDLENVPFLMAESNENEAEMEELKYQIGLAIDSLPSKCKIIFNLSRNSGMTYKEIAEELDISVKTVENQVGLAFRKLRTQLNPVWEKLMMLIFIFFL